MKLLLAYKIALVTFLFAIELKLLSASIPKELFVLIESVRSRAYRRALWIAAKIIVVIIWIVYMLLVIGISLITLVAL